MSSFYGGGYNSGGGSGTNYDELVNTPIKNIGGSGIFDLSTLHVGHYCLEGKYKATADSQIEYISNSKLDVLVLNDVENNTRTVHFTTVINGEVFFNAFTYDANDNLLDHKVVSLTNPEEVGWEGI